MWICREWTRTALNGWTSEFGTWETKEEAEEMGRIHVSLLRMDEEERDFEVYQEV